MSDTSRSSMISRRNAVGLLAATPANAVLSNALRGTALAGASILSAGAAQACGFAAAPSELSQLAAEHFEPLVGETFMVGGTTVTLRDVSRGPETTQPGLRQQFAVTFDAPRSLSLASDLSPVSHPAIGQYDLFVTEVIEGADRKALAIYFS
jgi:uncharacterized protein DUF6916